MKFVGLRMDEELLAWVDDRAGEEHRTRSNMIIRLIEEAKTAMIGQIRIAKKSTLS